MATPTIEERNYMCFTAADQETATKFKITSIAWTSNGADTKDIAVDDDMLLEDGNGTAIIGKRAEAAGDGLEMSFGVGIDATGLKAEDLDGGYLYVFGERI